MTILFVALGFLIIGIIYVIGTLAFIPGLADERLGRLEEFPEEAGEWVDDPGDARTGTDDATPSSQPRASTGLRRQSRLWIDPAPDWLGRERIFRQVRYLDSEGIVVRVGPEVRVRRRRRRG